MIKKQDRRAFLRPLLLIVFLSALLPALTGAVQAAPVQADLFTLTERRNMAITVQYDRELPEIRFIAPDGAEYAGSGELSPGLFAEYRENAVCYRIPDAMPGSWSIVYDKLSNESLQVSYAPYSRDISIDGFALQSIEDGWATVDFAVSFAQDTRFSFVIYAVILQDNGNVSGQKEVCSGSADANRPESVRFSLNALSSCDAYRLMLEVYLESGGIEVFDTVVSEEAFSFENRNTPAALSGVFIEADLTNQSIKLDWTDFQPYSCEKYLVAVFGAAQPDEPLFASSYDPGITVTEIPVRMDTDTLTVALSYEKNGLTSQVLRKDISLAAAARLTIETEEQTNAAQASVAYETTDRISAAVTVNGTTERLTLLGSGSFSVDLDEFYNELQVSWYPEETVCFVVKRSIYSDRTAPLLTLYENAAAITTDESSYVLAGETEPDCVLTVNGTAVVVSDDGTFLYRISLSQGDNSIAVSAKDAAGNATLQVIDIHKTSDTIFTAVGTGLSSLRKFLPLLVTFALSVLLIALIFIFSRQYGKNAPAGRIRAAAAICRNILAIGTLFLLSAAVLAFFMRANARARIDDPAFYNLAQASVADAYQAIKAYEQVDGLLQLSLILFGSCLVLSILLTLTLRRGKQKRKKTGAICPKCGAIHDEQVRFCKNCGEPMDEQPGAG